MICPNCGKTTGSLHRCQKKAKRPRKPPTTGSRARKARIRGMVKNYTADDWKRCVEAWGGKCAYCGSNGRLQQEHFYSVLEGGTYTPDNIIPACKKCNSAKSNKDPLEWLLTQKNGLATYARIHQYLSTLRPVDALARIYKAPMDIQVQSGAFLH
jgi:5-methylcytosine-specific restriction endonuclease McrA